MDENVNEVQPLTIGTLEEVAHRVTVPTLDRRDFMNLYGSPIHAVTAPELTRVSVVAEDDCEMVECSDTEEETGSATPIDAKIQQMISLVKECNYKVYIEAIDKDNLREVQDKLHDNGVFWSHGERHRLMNRECVIYFTKQFGEVLLAWQDAYYTPRGGLGSKNIIVNAKDFLADDYDVTPFHYDKPKHTILIRHLTMRRLIDIVQEVLQEDYKKYFNFYVDNHHNFDKYSVNELLSHSKLGTSVELHTIHAPKKTNFITNESDGSLYLNKHTSILTTTQGMFGAINDYEHTVNEDIANPIKIGKILNAMNISPQPLTSTQIEKITSAWKKQYTVDTSTVVTTDRIDRVYDMQHIPNGDLGGSCMRGQGYKMEIYMDLGCTVAYITKDGDENTLRARALVWNKVVDEAGNELVVYDRIFASDENARLTLEQHFKEQGIDSIKNHKVETILNVDGNWYDELPYIDNMYSLNSSYKLNNKGQDNYGYIQSTEGDYTKHGGSAIGNIEGSYCEFCDERYCHDELTYVENYGNICEYCLREDFVYCEDTNRHVRDSSDYYTCERSGNHYEDADSVIYCEDIGAYVYMGYADNLYYCEDQEEYHYNEPFKSEDGHYVADQDSCYYVEETNEYYFEESNYNDRLKELEDEREN